MAWPAGKANPLTMMTHGAALLPSRTQEKACRTKGHEMGVGGLDKTFISYKASSTTVTGMKEHSRKSHSECN